MKIVFIGQKGIPATLGGVERHVQELAERLVERENEVYVYTRCNYIDKKLKEYKGIKLISLPSFSTKNMDALSHTFLACLNLIFKQKNIDIIHFHSIGPSSLIWLIKLFKPSVPVVTTFHSKCYHHQKWGKFAKLYLRFGEIMCCKLSNRVIAVSKSLKKYAEHRYKRKINYIPNGTNISKVTDAERIKKWGLTNNNYIVSVSRLIQHKGIHYLIQAYNSIKTDKKLVIVGEGVYTNDYFQKLKKLANNNPNIIFTGKQTGDTLSELFFNAYLFAHPSESEGLSIALLEAMSYKKAILSSDILENQEAGGVDNFYFKNKDIKDLKNKLEYLLKHPEKLKLVGLINYQRIKKYYNWDNITKDTIEIYKKVVKINIKN